LLVFGTHADDETIGSGGLVRRVVDEGGEAVVCCVRVESGLRGDELAAACEVLGASWRVLVGPWGDWLDSQPLANLVGMVTGTIEQVRPDVVVIPDPAGFHQEHQAVARAALAAMRPSGGTGRWRPRVVLASEQPADGWPSARPVVNPAVYVSLTEQQMRAKADAMASHASQCRPVPSERSLEALWALARLRGAQAGCEFAEAYGVLRWLV
jgi:LmbE family N-acetylglucosaminyl deacetylase